MAVEEWNFIQINSHTSSSIRETPVQYTMSRTLGGILWDRVKTQDKYSQRLAVFPGLIKHILMPLCFILCFRSLNPTQYLNITTATTNLASISRKLWAFWGKTLGKSVTFPLLFLLFTQNVYVRNTILNKKTLSESKRTTLVQVVFYCLQSLQITWLLSQRKMSIITPADLIRWSSVSSSFKWWKFDPNHHCSTPEMSHSAIYSLATYRSQVRALCGPLKSSGYKSQKRITVYSSATQRQTHLRL